MTGVHAIHGTVVAVAIDWDGPLVGILILGESGAGKSSLALLSIETCPYRRTALVADDLVLIDYDGRALLARAPESTAGLLEVRGVGLMKMRREALVELQLVIDFEIEPSRLPEVLRIQPISNAPALPQYPFRWEGSEAAAAARLRMIARAVVGGQILWEAQDGGSNACDLSLKG